MSPFEGYKQTLRQSQPVGLAGRASAVRGLTVSVSDFPVPVGAVCRIEHSGRCVEGRVVGFVADQTLVMPMGPMTGIRRGDRVVCTSTAETAGVGPAMLGRVLDGVGRPIDGRGELPVETSVPLWPDPITPLKRVRITEPLCTGIRAIDGMLTVGRGQRMGIFSASGVGKSVLLGMIGRYTSADVIVVALIGERGREVRDFIERDLGADGLARAVVVVSTSDEPPLVLVRAVAVAAATAEYFRDRGCNVMLLVDSLTRLATAQRQIGLAAGEPPTGRGYTPSVFSLLPQLLERSGRTERGSITGFYTVLVEAEQSSDPICEAVRAASDGHIWLSRDMANYGRYPAVDVLQSVSRVMMDVTDQRHRAAAGELRRLIAMFADIEELLNVGAYQTGANDQCDLAIAAIPEVRRFLAQRIDERSEFQDTVGRLDALYERIGQLRRRLTGREPAGRAVPAA